MSLRRLYGLCAVLVLLAGVVLCRTYWVGQQTAYAASAGGQSVQTLTLPRARGDFYDRTGRRLTGLSPRYYALCLPGDAGYTALFPYVPYAEQSLLYERRNLASPFLIQVDRDLTAQGITTCTVPQHFGGSIAAHRRRAHGDLLYDRAGTPADGHRPACSGGNTRHGAGRAADAGRRPAARL